MSIDIETGLQLQIKRPGEFYPFTFVFTNLADGETISTVDSVDQVRRGAVAGSVNVDLSSTSHDSASKGQAWIDNGTDGEYYCMTMWVTTSLGAKRACSGVLYVKGVC